MSKEYVVIKSARSSRRYRAKGYTLQAWRISPYLPAPRRGMLIGPEEQQLIRDLIRDRGLGGNDWEVRAYPAAAPVVVVKDEDMRFDFFFSDRTPGINPKALHEAAPFHEGSRRPPRRMSISEVMTKLRALPVGGKLMDWDESYIVRIK